MGHAAHLLDYLARAAVATLAELALVLGPFLVLALVAQVVTHRAERRVEALVGRRARWLAVGWAATALHEGGHAVFALLFGHRVRRVKWFDFDAQDGTLGQVEHDYDPTSLYQRAGRCFIGVAPVLVGALVLGLAARLLLGARTTAVARLSPEHGLALHQALAAQLGAATREVGQLASAIHPGSWRAWTFLYLAFVAGSAMRLSGSDARSFAAGGWTIVWLLLLANAATLWAGDVGPRAALHAARAMALCDAALLAAVVLQVLVGVLALGLTLLAGALRHRSAAPARG